MRPTLLVNHINCRYKSSRTTGNIHMLQVKPSATREKRPKARSLQTDIARGNGKFRLKSLISVIISQSYMNFQ